MINSPMQKDTIETILHNSSTMLESVSVILEEHQDSMVILFNRQVH